MRSDQGVVAATVELSELLFDGAVHVVWAMLIEVAAFPRVAAR